MSKLPYSKKGTPILSRGGDAVGTATGSTHTCRLAGCRGVRVAVRWSNGKVTYPCSKGILQVENGWEIQ
jgi:hypothetical protein